MSVLAILIAERGFRQAAAGLDRSRATGATRYVAARMGQARQQAVSPGPREHPVRPTPGSRYEMALFVDGNRNGVRARDIATGVDRQLDAAERLRRHRFPASVSP